jgi:hypothetical protein
VELGGARVERVRGSVSESLPVGLLGTSFFNHFTLQIDPAARMLTLVPNPDMHGGASQAQWSERFRGLRERQRRLEAFLADGALLDESRARELEGRRDSSPSSRRSRRGDRAGCLGREGVMRPLHCRIRGPWLGVPSGHIRARARTAESSSRATAQCLAPRDRTAASSARSRAGPAHAPPPARRARATTRRRPSGAKRLGRSRPSSRLERPARWPVGATAARGLGRGLRWLRHGAEDDATEGPRREQKRLRGTRRGPRRGVPPRRLPPGWLR